MVIGAWIVKPGVAEQGMVPILAQAPLFKDEIWIFPKAQESWPESDLAYHSRGSISLSHPPIAFRLGYQSSPQLHGFLRVHKRRKR